MFLKSLTLRGFKSFADPTTLQLEPGVTVVVGPNGSGKSNVVDAVAWVLGAQGPRTLRSSKMDDVIFAGTARRPALGRAEVSLTIDNSAGRLAVDLSEVTVTRTLFRTGESEYALNGVPCRLLDVQEIFSDTGVGRQQHVIVGQGQLDAILSARPEDRRAVIEEAAGILKYRRRRERAERRLEASEANLTRLHDLLREVRRQHKPLERQAEAARRNGELVTELRGLRLHLAGRELGELARRAAAAEEASLGLGADEARLRAELQRLDEVVDAGESLAASVRDGDVRPLLSRGDTLRERARGLAAVLAERSRSLSASLEALAGADVIAALEAESASLDTGLAEAERRAAELVPEWEVLAAEQELLASEREQLDEHYRSPSAVPVPIDRARADLAEARNAGSRRREALARSHERAAALEWRGRELAESLERTEAVLARLSDEIDAGRLKAAAASGEAAAASGANVRADEELRAAERSHDAAVARADALGLALDEARARAGVEQLAGLAGVVGTLLDAVEVGQGYELAFEAAVEGSLEAVVVAGVASALEALEQLRASRGGGAVLVAGAGGHEEWAAAEVAGAVAAGGEPLRRHVRSAIPEVDRLLDSLLDGCVLYRGGLREACDLAIAVPRLVVVTPEGDRLAPAGWRVGAGRAGATRAALDDALEAVATARAAADEAGAVAATARAEWEAARGRADERSQRLELLLAEQARLTGTRGELDTSIAALGTELAAARAEMDLLAARAEEDEILVAAREALVGSLERAEADEKERLALERSARALHEERARAHASLRGDLEVRAAGLEERRAMLTERLAEVERRLAAHHAGRAEAGARRSAIEERLAALGRLSAAVHRDLERLEGSRARLAAEEERRSTAERELAARLGAARHERAGLEQSLAGVRERAQRLEIELAELRVRRQTAEDALRHELDVEPSEVLGAPCPEVPPGTTPAAQARDLERELRLLGPVNPLALEELAALEERSAFLEHQLEDVRSARRELGGVIRAVDAEIATVFEAAFADVARHFEGLFSTLFPGGSGSLSLTAADTPLDAGVEIEAKPAGRNVRRLSLLSGGERSLVALAFLFAVFRSRPSPFYLMDEVEAALDDVNLHRFLDLVDEFRGEAQLILVSHQKRTMEAADVLYGVTMQPGGASKVVSERMARRS